MEAGGSFLISCVFCASPIETFPSPLWSAETDDYAEIIDEEDTYTMPSSK